jgi:hypothetical protein
MENKKITRNSHFLFRPCLPCSSLSQTSMQLSEKNGKTQI